MPSMTEEEIQKIKEHIEVHAGREPRAVKITQILRKAVVELEKGVRMSKLKKMMRELRINRRYARSLLHEFKQLESLQKRKLREALVRRKSAWQILR